MSPLKRRCFKACCDICGLVHWSVPKQFLVAKKAISKNWKHFSEPCSWIQIMKCVCVCVCVCKGVTLVRRQSLCLPSLLWDDCASCPFSRSLFQPGSRHHRSQLSKTVPKSPGLSCQLCKEALATISDKEEGNHSLTRRTETRGLLCLFLSRKERNPREVWTVLRVKWCLQTHPCPGGAGSRLQLGRASQTTDGGSGVHGRGGSGELGLEESGPAERQWSWCGQDGQAPCTLEPVPVDSHGAGADVPGPRGWARTPVQGPLLQRRCFFFF